MKIQILILAIAYVYAGIWGDVLTGVATGALCVVTAGAGCVAAAAGAVATAATTDAVQYAASEAVASGAVTQQTEDDVTSDVSSAVSYGQDALDLVSDISDVTRLGRAEGMDPEVVKAFRFVVDGVAKALPNLKEHLSFRHDMKMIKQFFYKGHDVTEHLYSMRAGYLTGKSGNGDNYKSYGIALGKFMGHIAKLE